MQMNIHEKQSASVDSCTYPQFNSSYRYPAKSVSVLHATLNLTKVDLASNVNNDAKL